MFGSILGALTVVINCHGCYRHRRGFPNNTHGLLGSPIVVQRRQDSKLVSVGWYTSSMTPGFQVVAPGVNQILDSDLDPMLPESTRGY